MARSYVKDGEIRIPIQSDIWDEYQKFLSQRLDKLTEKKTALETELRELNKDIQGVLELLNPEDEKNITKPEAVRVEEIKYHSLAELAKKIKVDVPSILLTCDKGKVPCHRINGEWKFTNEDIEQIRCSMSRGLKWETPVNPTVGTLTSQEVCEVLGVRYDQCVHLRKKGLLVGKTEDGQTGGGRGNKLYFNKSEVNALAEMIKADGGYDSFLENLRASK